MNYREAIIELNEIQNAMLTENDLESEIQGISSLGDVVDLWVELLR